MRQPERGGCLFRLLVLVCFVALIGLLFLVRHPLYRVAGRWLAESDAPTHADAIIIIGDDDYTGDRAFRAADLYRAGWAPTVVASGKMLRPYSGIAQLIEKDVESDGVPASAVVRFDQNAQDTREEAAALSKLVADRQWSQVMVVTSNYHAHRARYIFKKVFPATVSVSVIAARDTNFDPESWWESRQGRKLFFLEIVGYAEAWWELHASAN
jgi:uncharacterized SAM-binding protein YcdF (DUF218 family)